MDKHLHIVTHEIPFPVKHGGLVDLYYKIVALHKLGVKIHLYCFSKKIIPQQALTELCFSVHYFKRSTGIQGLSATIPYIVKSRRSNELIKLLLQDEHPILLEGIHCTWILHNESLKSRKIFVRLHNVEYRYYKQLQRSESNIFKKIYYNIESALLKKYEKIISSKAIFLAVSRQDLKIYSKEFNSPSIHFLPVFLPYNTVSSHPGTGNYCLYHGNLSISENVKAVEWLLKEVFNKIEIPFVVAGSKPSTELVTISKQHTNTCLVADPDESEMQDLIKKAQINVLPSFNNTGVKLKLLNALYNGRHCVVNKAAIDNASINELCHVGNNATEVIRLIQDLYTNSFSLSEINHRQSILQGIYDNEKNALRLMTLIW